MRLSVIILIAALVVGGAVISLGFLNEPEIGEVESREDLSAFEKLEKYRDDLVRINEDNIQVLEDVKAAADPDADADSPSGQEIAVLEQVIAQNVEEIQEISERLAGMVSPP